MEVLVRAGGGRTFFYGATSHARRGFAGLAKKITLLTYLFFFVDVTSLHTFSYIYSSASSQKGNSANISVSRAIWLPTCQPWHFSVPMEPVLSVRRIGLNSPS